MCKSQTSSWKSPRGKVVRMKNDLVIQEGSSVHNEKQSNKPKENRRMQKLMLRNNLKRGREWLKSLLRKWLQKREIDQVTKTLRKEGDKS